MGKNILFRCDAGIKNGLGHLSRCIVLSSEMINQGYTPFFLIKTDTIEKIEKFLKSKNLEAISFEFILQDVETETELQIIRDILRNKKIKIIVLDHYGVTYSYCSEIKDEGVSVLQFDYSGKSHFASDIILNPNPGAGYIDYKNIIASNQKLLAGIQYALIDQEFKNIKSAGKFSAERKNVVFALGGSDRGDNVIRSFIRLLNDLEECHFRYYFPDSSIDSVKNKENENILSFSSHEMYIISIQNADIVVCNAGVTATEMLFLNKQCIVLNMADNQYLNWCFYKEHFGFAYETDEFLKLFEQGEEFFFERMKSVPDDKSSFIPDGNGAKRVVNEIGNLFS